MTEESRNVETLRRAYADWHESKGDYRVWFDILADHVSWGSIGDGKPGMDFARPRASKEEVVRYFEGLAEDWSMEFYHINEYVAQGGRVVAIGECSWTNRKTGKTAHVAKVDVWQFEDGRAIQFMEYFDTHAATSAAQE